MLRAIGPPSADGDAVSGLPHPGGWPVTATRAASMAVPPAGYSASKAWGAWPDLIIDGSALLDPSRRRTLLPREARRTSVGSSWLWTVGRKMSWWCRLLPAW